MSCSLSNLCPAGIWYMCYNVYVYYKAKVYLSYCLSLQSCLIKYKSQCHHNVKLNIRENK